MAGAARGKPKVTGYFGQKQFKAGGFAGYGVDGPIKVVIVAAPFLDIASELV
jgi:hypothetical protein